MSNTGSDADEPPAERPAVAAMDEHRFQLLVNSVTDYAIYMLDADGYVATWNPGARRFKGYEAGEIVGKHFSLFFTPEDRAAGKPARALATAAAEGRFEAEGWRLRKDGTRFWVNAVLDPIRADDGTLLGFAKITRDITARRESEQALYRSEQQFRMLVQGVRDYAIYMLDRDGVITNWNSGATAIKGYAADEVIGKHFSHFYTEEDRARGDPHRALTTALREGKYETEGWRIRKDGTRFWSHVVLDPIHDDDGQHIGFAKITRDVTERRRAEEQLADAQAALFQSQKLQALGELTGGIAHDFNNLMTVIRGSAELLRSVELKPEKRERYLDAIIETADRASTLTSHLLAFGRRQPLKPEVVDLNLRLDAFAEMASRTLGGQIEIRLDLAPGLWPTEVDSAQLETALLNAAINARDAMPNGGILTIATRNVPGKDGDLVCVSLKDEGEGMTDEVRSRVFEPFFTTKPVGKGTGLGLSQIHGFAAQTGGRAEIESTTGVGTTIFIFLPRSTRPLSEISQDGEVLRPGAGLTILLVEDNDHVREFAENLLQELRYHVISCDSADAALEVLENRHVDLLFSDIVMPGRSGFDLARAVRSRFPDVPILLASGYSDEILAGASEFEVLAKPYGAAALNMALARALGQRLPAATA